MKLSPLTTRPLAAQCDGADLAAYDQSRRAAYRCSRKGSTSEPSSATRKRRPMRHQAADEMHIARKSIEL
jgi:hypothetical protein